MHTLITTIISQQFLHLSDKNKKKLGHFVSKLNCWSREEEVNPHFLSLIINLYLRFLANKLGKMTKMNLAKY